MKMYLCFVLAFCFFLRSSAAAQVTVLSSQGTAPFNGDWLLAFLYDGNNGRCYASKTINGYADLIIVPSEISQIRIFNRDFMPERLTGVQVQVCDGATCHPCGVTAPTGPSAWTTVNCAGGPLSGDRVHFIGTASGGLNFCEVQIEGNPLPKVEILASEGTGPFNGDWLMEFLYDGSYSRCYASKTLNGYANLYFVTAEVSQVRLFNRDFMPERLTGVSVEVCEGTKCTACGVTTATGPKAWATITCAGGPVRGNRLYFKGTPNGGLNFCEVQITGKTVASSVGIVGANADAPFNNDWQIAYGFHTPGAAPDNGKCYCSIAVGATAHLDIPDTQVYQVALLNRNDATFAKRMEGITVEVCDKEGSCQSCGSMPATSPAKWAVVNCPNGAITGNQIKLHQSRDALQFCESKVFGTPAPPKKECFCQDYHRFCQGLHDPNFMKEYQALVAEGKLDGYGNKHEMPIPTCSDHFYQIGCPRSCKKCSC